MMLFKLSLKNIRKSFKDYAIYFFTIILGVAIFYMFNSIDSQEARLAMNSSSREIIKLLINLLSGVSVFISVILGFLIIYANNFLIKRRKKEFGTYMLLGMGKRQVSKILVIETILIGIISLGVGLLIGVFASQFMSVLVAKMFEVNMTKFEFVFSKSACTKTLIYFSIMYIAVLIFNTFIISKYKLIDLLTAIKKNEKVKIKNTFLCVVIFIISICILAFSYYKVTVDYKSLLGENFPPMVVPIIGGCVGTFLFFWSLSGFLLQVIKTNKSIYLKNTNMFVLRQLNSKINTTVFSMTIICLMLFVTICVLSSAISLNNSFKKSITELTPVDIQISKRTDIESFKENATQEEIEDSKVSIKEVLGQNGFDINSKFKDIVTYNRYKIDYLTLEQALGDSIDEVKEKYPFLNVNTKEDLITLSEYNKIAKAYGREQYSLNENEYIVIADYGEFIKIRNMALNKKVNIEINGKQYVPKYQECKKEFIDIAGNHCNMGIIILPDSALSSKDVISKNMIANYNAKSEDEKQAIEKEISNIYVKTYDKYMLFVNSKLDIYEAATGLTAIVIFLALYLGIIFLIASSAILALKELTDSSDNKQRYDILRKIGTDEKMINRTLFVQIAIFFLIPLALAIVHSIFGISFALNILKTINEIDDLVWPIVITAVFIALIYGGYFVITYLSSKNIIKEDV